MAKMSKLLRETAIGSCLQQGVSTYELAAHRGKN